MLTELILMNAVTLGIENPQELGDVHWGRNVDQAISQSGETGKPVFVQFQEIPGCATCRNFGDGPLSQPLIVEALETEFHPVAIYNNREGEDEKVLKRFSEPSWNNPVIRILDQEGKDVLPRRERLYSIAAVSTRMIDALEAVEREVPEYLKLVRLESSARTPERVYFAMHCYWQGEAKLGSLDGVLETRCAWYDGREVVEVVFDSAVLPLARLVGRALELDCASAVYVGEASQVEAARVNERLLVKRLEGEARQAKASDQRYFLSRSSLRYVPMSEAQAVRVNAALGTRSEAAAFLSPRQREIASALEKLSKAGSDKLAGFTEHARLADLESVSRKLELAPR